MPTCIPWDKEGAATGVNVETETRSKFLAADLVSSLLDTVDRPLLVTERHGKVLFANLRAQQILIAQGI